MKKVLITDLDDTLYSWIDFFIPSFYAMIDEVHAITGIKKETLIEEYKQVHQKYGNVEHPFSTLELPSILTHYFNLSKVEIKKVLDEAFHKFNSIRKKTLTLYPSVYETLEYLFNKGVIIIGYTESSLKNGFYRLQKLNIEKFFKHVYVGEYGGISTSNNKVYAVKEKKPNPLIIEQIASIENVSKEEIIYVGDSLTKDIYMAIQAGVTSVWMNPQKEKNDYYQKLVDITSWTEEDFKREKKLKETISNNNLSPDFEISEFSSLVKIIESFES